MHSPLPLATLDHAASRTASRPPLVILHGLLASSRHWRTVASELASQGPAFALDLRNHGRSPRSTAMDFPVMVEGLLAWLDRRGLHRIDLPGHSMGGKLAMAFARRHPERVRRFVVESVIAAHNGREQRSSDFLSAT